ncbi:ribosome recycling factor, partial [Myxococcota bacterium]
ILDGVRVNYYGSPTPLNQCANVAVVDARLISVKPWDKSQVAEIEKAILTADIGITPQSDGEIIRLPVPSLTEERRRDLVKHSKHRGEEARIALRTHRRDANEMLKEAEKEKEISQDDLKRALEKVQQATNKGTEKVDEILVAKEKEILEI